MNILSIDYGIIASLSLRGRKMNLGLNDIINIREFRSCKKYRI